MAERHTWWRQMPWHDPLGRVAPVKLALFVAMWLPAVWMALSFSSIDWMFPSPFVPLIYHSGLWATYLLLLSLAITPLRRILEWGRAAQLRRMIGVAAFAYTLLHIVAWLGLRFWDWSALLMELLARPSLWVAALSAAGLLALAATSFDSAMRRMGGLAWKNLHRIVYGADVSRRAALSSCRRGSLQGAPFLMAGAYVWLMGWRLARERHRLGRPVRAPSRLLGTLSLQHSALTLILQPLWLATFQLRTDVRDTVRPRSTDPCWKPRCRGVRSTWVFRRSSCWQRCRFWTVASVATDRTAPHP
jgi:sulfoxide reductase heme-binding subunit YedZ